MTQTPSSTADGKDAAKKTDARKRVEQRLAALEQAERRQVTVEFPMLAKLSFVLVFAAIMVSWWGTFKWMWSRWFPGWHNLNTSLYERLTEGESYYTHGPLVPLTSLVVGWMIYKRVGLPIVRTTGSKVVGWLVFAAFAFLHLASVYARVDSISGFALIGMLTGLLLVYGGFPFFKAYWMPIVILFFMVPLPASLIDSINFSLRNFAAASAVKATNLLGVAARIENNVVHLPPGPDGPKSLVVANVCGGLRSLISLTFFAALFALVCRVKGFWRVVLLLLAVPVAVLCNVIRITSLNIVAHFFGTDAAGEHSAFHGLSGIAVFGVALAIMFGLEWLIIRGSKLFKVNWVDDRLMGYLDKLPKARQQWPNSVRPIVIGVMVLITAWSLWWGAASPAVQRSDRAKHAVQDGIRVDSIPMMSEDSKLPQRDLIILQTNDYLNREYWHPAIGMVHLLIVFSEDNRKGTHPPDICLQGSGHEIVRKQDIRLDMPTDRMQSSELGFRELITQRAGGTHYFLYTYKCGYDYTPSFFSQQFRIFYNGLRGENAAGALIRYTVPNIELTDESIAEARQLAHEAARQLMPQIEQGL